MATSLDQRPQQPEQQYDPRMVALMKQYGIWHPGLVYPAGSHRAIQESQLLAHIHDTLARQDASAEADAQRRDIHNENAAQRIAIHNENATQRRDYQSAVLEDRQTGRENRAAASEENTAVRRAGMLQLLASDPSLSPAERALVKQEMFKAANIQAPAAAASTTSAKGEYGPGGAPKTTAPTGTPAPGVPSTTPPPPKYYEPGAKSINPNLGPNEFSRTGPASGVYGPGTLGSSTGIDYYGPMTAAGRPASASSGPWTVRAHDTGERTPLPADAFARRFGHTNEQDLSQGLGTAAIVDVMHQRIPEGESGVNAYADIGGADMEKAIAHLMRSTPGQTTQFPEVYGPKGSHISNASTYYPLPNEVFQPSILSALKSGGPKTQDIGYVDYKMPVDSLIREGSDPRYMAQVMKDTAINAPSVNAMVEKGTPAGRKGPRYLDNLERYQMYAKGQMLENAAKNYTFTQQQGPDRLHTFMTPTAAFTLGGTGSPSTNQAGGGGGGGGATATPTPSPQPQLAGGPQPNPTPGPEVAQNAQRLVAQRILQAQLEEERKRQALTTRVAPVPSPY